MALDVFLCFKTHAMNQSFTLDRLFNSNNYCKLKSIVNIKFQIVEYNIPNRKYTQFSNNLQSRLPKQWLARQFPITNIIFDPHNENIIIMHDDSGVYVINKNSETLSPKEAKIAKIENDECTEDSNSLSSWQAQHTFRIVKKYKVKTSINCNYNDYSILC